MTQTPPGRPPTASYRALLAVPTLGRVLLAMQISRIAGSMLGVTIVLFTLTTFNSPVLAGVVTFFGIVPGLHVSPIAGALLDRHGRIRLVILDYLIALGSLVLIAVLAAAGVLSAPLLVAIAALASLSAPLSATGVRSLFPVIVPSHLWERVNAVDSNGWLLASVIGPPLAAGLVATLGGPVALIAVGIAFGLAAVALIGVPDPPSTIVSSGRLLRDSWDGLVYTLGNPTLRGLAAAISVVNIAGGIVVIVIPVIVLRRLGLGEFTVGLIFAVQGLTGMASAFFVGRLDTRGRERRMLVWPMIGSAAALTLLLVPWGVAPLVVALGLVGLTSGPMDVALFTLRQRVTDPAWTGRAFAISMSLNFLGQPVGSVIAGWLVATSIDAAVGVAIGAGLLGAYLAASLIPQPTGPGPRSAQVA